MRHLFVALLLLAAAPAFAGDGIDGVRAQVVNSLAVSGTIEIDAQGKVLRYEIAHPEAYTQGVRDLLARDIPHWTVAPVLKDGVPRAVRAGMYLRLQAKPLGGDKYKVDVASAAFGYDEPTSGSDVATTAALDGQPPGDGIANAASGGNAPAPAPAAHGPSKRMAAPPGYPLPANRANVGATVVVALLVDTTGKVENAVVEQTNVRAVAEEKTMDRWRAMFEQEALTALKRWTFDPAVVGTDRGVEPVHASVRVPVVFIPAPDIGKDGPGHWDSYVPGPRHRIPWVADDARTAGAGIDALPAGGVFPVQQDVRLLTHLGDG
jgi:TonB family protein